MVKLITKGRKQPKLITGKVPQKDVEDKIAEINQSGKKITQLTTDTDDKNWKVTFTLSDGTETEITGQYDQE